MTQSELDLRSAKHAAYRSGVRALQPGHNLRTSVGIARDYQRRPSSAHHLGNMDDSCSGCGAAHFRDEKATPGRTQYMMCCAKNTVELPLFEPFPETLRSLYLNQDDDSKSFRKFIRNYNNALPMASMTADIVTPQGFGPYCFRVHGQVYHTIGGLQPRDGDPPQCAQVLIMDTNEAAQELCGRDANRVVESTFRTLHNMLNDSNPYVRAFRLMAQVADEESRNAQEQGRTSRPVRMVFEQNNADDHRRYNFATANEVAIVYVGDEESILGDRFLVIHEQTGNLKFISQLDKLCDPLTYTLLFPSGGHGWHPEMERTEYASPRRARVTQKQYYSFVLSTRDRQFNPLHYAGKLLQQFIVDSWLKIEMNRLNFIRQNQHQLRLDTVQGLQLI
ncbi:uncharacterized protein LOC108864329 [Galendromus occidentalis]|uniref:Uncharacterized protein LOC108864329 n=1 Tax=Galendromus occidentalis TaxID=34638 RepID=A0AAJ7PAC2_9ACAR|nr:uncharacterized protein LOC108864329 [Galendromus occidentalis]